MEIKAFLKKLKLQRLLAIRFQDKKQINVTTAIFPELNLAQINSYTMLL